MPKAHVNRAELEAWKEGKGKKFVDRLAMLTEQFSPGQSQHFDPNNQTHLQRAHWTQTEHNRFYILVKPIFDAYLTDLTGLNLADVFRTFPQSLGEEVFSAFGEWVLVQSYLDASLDEGNGRLERIVADDAAYQQKRKALAQIEVPTTQELKALWNKCDLYETACHPWRNWAAAKKARKKIGGEMRGMVAAVLRGRKKLRALRREVAATDAAMSRAEKLTREVAALRQSILAALSANNGLPSGPAWFKDTFRILLDQAKQGQPLIDEDELALGQARAEVDAAETLLECLRKLKAKRKTDMDVGIQYFYDIQDPVMANQEEMVLSAQVGALLVKGFAEELKREVGYGRKEGLIDFRSETARHLKRLRLHMSQAEALAALRGVLNQQIRELEMKALTPQQADLLAVLKTNLEILW